MDRLAELVTALRQEGDPRVIELIELIQPHLERERRSRSVLDFVVNLSHELRTPLNAVIGYSELVEEELEGGYAAALIPDVRRIRGAGSQVLGLVNDLLDLSKLESGKLELNPEPFDVRELLDDVQATLDPLVAEQGNRLDVTIGTGVGEMIADPTRVRQCLLNLLSNANKFTEAGRLDLRAERITPPGAPDRLHFAISDTGVGMSSEELSRLFNRFEQARADTAKRYGGTGLGLALTRELVVRMGGAIDVTSAPGVGTTFDVDLPLEAQDF